MPKTSSFLQLDRHGDCDDTQQPLSRSRVWSVSKQSGGSGMHAHALHRLEAHLVDDDVSSEE